MIDHESRGSADDPPASSTQRRDERAVRTICSILRVRFELPAKDVSLNSRFVEDLGMDVFDLPDLVLALEETFEVDISLAVAARILTLRDAVRCVLSK
jgi:acyl carrier protein